MLHKLTCIQKSFNFCLVLDLPKAQIFLYNFENRIKLLSKKLKDEEKIAQDDFEGKEILGKFPQFHIKNNFIRILREWILIYTSNIPFPQY